MSPAESTAAGSDDKGSLPWTMIPKFTPGVTDVTEWTKKLRFLSEIWPKDQLPALTTRVALQCEGTAFKRISRIDRKKLKAPGTAGIQLIVSSLGGAWGPLWRRNTSSLSGPSTEFNKTRTSPTTATCRGTTYALRSC